jgi:hypothetical protein
MEYLVRFGLYSGYVESSRDRTLDRSYNDLYSKCVDDDCYHAIGITRYFYV